MLDIGIIVDSPRVPAWVAKVVRELRTSPQYRLAFVAAVATTEGGMLAHAAFSRRATGKAVGGHTLFRVYRWLDYHLTRARDNAFARVDLERGVDPLPVARWTVPAAGSELDLTAAIGELAAGLDVLLDLSSVPLPTAIGTCARFGVWSCHDGEARRYEESPPLFDEMYHGVPIAAAVVQCRTGSEDAARVLSRGTFVLDRKSYFLSRNRSAWSGAAYLLRRLDELALRGWEHLRSAPSWQDCDPYSKHAVPMPTAGTTCCFVGRMARRRVDRWSERFAFLQPWLVAYRAGEKEGLGIGDWGRRDEPTDPSGRPVTGPQSPGPLPRLRFLLPPAERFYADPFPLEHEGRRFIFFEDSRHKPVKGVISYVKLDAAGRAGEPKTALQTDCHLSYPFLFTWEGRPYMIPETFQHRRIELYRAEDFPDRWMLDRVLVDNVAGVDATLMEFDGLWWMFVSHAAPSRAFGPELSLYLAETPLGPFVAHPGNPIVTEVRQARPAGRPFLLGDRLIRPGQDCSARWGFAISFNRVELLSRTDYRERAVARLEPDWFPGAIATHTYNRSQTVEVVDVQVPVRRKANFLAATQNYAQLCNRCRSEDYQVEVDRRLSQRLSAAAGEIRGIPRFRESSV